MALHSGCKDAKTSITTKSIDFFRALAEDWWDESGTMAALHSMHPVRMQFLLQYCTNIKGKYFLDVGCGCGITSESLARLGAKVMAIDPVAESIGIASTRAVAQSLPIEYANASLFDLEANTAFDVLCMFEVLEHFEGYSDAIAQALKLLRKGGFLFISTINKTARSLVEDIWIAEHILKIAKPGTHQWDLFVPLQELKDQLNAHGKILEVKGLKYSIFTNRWHFSRNVQTNYILAFRKNA